MWAAGLQRSAVGSRTSEAWTGTEGSVGSALRGVPGRNETAKGADFAECGYTTGPVPSAPSAVIRPLQMAFADSVHTLLFVTRLVTAGKYFGAT
jgi:hypothetical protein